MRIKRVLALAGFLAVALVTSGATANNAAACADGSCLEQCQCLAGCDAAFPSQSGTNWEQCRNGCYFWHQCDEPYICP